MKIVGLWGIPGLVWPRTKELMDKALKETLTSRELLALKSRSFYIPIQLSELARGKGEESKERHITICYNVAREADEGEDASDTLTKEEKIAGLRTISFVIGEIARIEPNCNTEKALARLEDIIKGDDFRTLTRDLIKGAVGEEERVFVEQFGKGEVLRDMYKIISEGAEGKRIIKALDYCIKGMTDAMATFLEKGPIETSRQLDDYTYHVAGRVGSDFLNELVRLKDKVELDDELAGQFGRFLQLINIAKNIREDYIQGRKFLAGEWIHRGLSYEFMMDGKSMDAERVRNNVLNRILLFIDTRFDASVDYVKSVPPELSGYKAFCLVPLITGKKTTETMRNAGAENVFLGREDAIKIGMGGMGAITNFSYYTVKHENGGRTNDWLEEFRKDPRQFSFKPEDYVKWAPNWIGVDSAALKEHLGIS